MRFRAEGLGLRVSSFEFRVQGLRPNRLVVWRRCRGSDQACSFWSVGCGVEGFREGRYAALGEDLGDVGEDALRELQRPVQGVCQRPPDAPFARVLPAVPRRARI